MVTPTDSVSRVRSGPAPYVRSRYGPSSWRGRNRVSPRQLRPRSPRNPPRPRSTTHASCPREVSVANYPLLTCPISRVEGHPLGREATVGSHLGAEVTKHSADCRTDWPTVNKGRPLSESCPADLHQSTRVTPVMARAAARVTSR